MKGFYQRFLALGEHNYPDDFDKRRARVLNFLIFWAVLTIIPFVITINLPKENPFELYTILATLFITLFSLYLNSKGFNQQAVFGLIGSQIITVWLILLIVPTQTGAPFGNLLAALVSVTLIKKRTTRMLFLMISIVSFLGSNFIQLKYKTFVDAEYGAVVFILFLLFLGILYHDKLMLAYQEKIQEQGEDLVKLKEESHQKEMQLKEKDLEVILANASVRDQLTENITSKLKEISKSDDMKQGIEKVIRDLNAQSELINKQTITNQNLDELNSEFYDRLLTKFPDLTKAERELSAYLKLNMSNKEIAALKNSTENSVNVSKARLRKKLGIETNKELARFLMHF